MSKWPTLLKNSSFSPLHCGVTFVINHITVNGGFSIQKWYCLSILVLLLHLYGKSSALVFKIVLATPHFLHFHINFKYKFCVNFKFSEKINLEFWLASHLVYMSIFRRICIFIISKFWIVYDIFVPFKDLFNIYKKVFFSIYAYDSCYPKISFLIMSLLAFGRKIILASDSKMRSVSALYFMKELVSLVLFHP
jgi:hypothetical protein